MRRQRKVPSNSTKKIQKKKGEDQSRKKINNNKKNKLIKNGIFVRYDFNDNF